MRGLDIRNPAPSARGNRVYQSSFPGQRAGIKPLATTIDFAAITTALLAGSPDILARTPSGGERVGLELTPFIPRPVDRQCAHRARTTAGRNHAIRSGIASSNVEAELVGTRHRHRGGQ
jgi:hypothetical protein